MSYWTNSQENNPQMKQWLKKVSCSPVLQTLYPVPHSSILKWLRHLVNWGSFKRTNISKASSEIKSKAISNWCLIPPWTKPLNLYFECVNFILKRRGWTLGLDTKLDWCRDAPCGMGVISSPSRLISKGLSRRGAHCWATSLPRTMTAMGQANDTVLVEIGIASEEAMEMGGDERGQKGTLCPGGEDWRMWGFGPGREQLVSWDWVGGLEGTGLRWAGLALSLTHTHPLPGTLPGNSVAVMPLNSRLHHTHTEQSRSPLQSSTTRSPPTNLLNQECDKDSIKIKKI